MRVPRETIYAALFERIARCASFKKTERQPRHWTDVPVEEMPYMAMGQDDGGNYERKHKLPPKITLQVTLYVYVHTGASMDKTVVSDQLLNPILDAIEAAMESPVSDPGRIDSVNSLGGLVYSCNISGLVETSGGMLGDVAYAMIPVEIVVPS